MRSALLALAILVGCAASHGEGEVFGDFPQEPIAATAILPWGNRVLFGRSVAANHYAEVVTKIDARVGGSLPGVSFEVYGYPLVVAGGVHSFRAPSRRLIVLSWWNDLQGAWAFGDLEWEVSHYLSGTDDFGNPWRG